MWTAAIWLYEVSGLWKETFSRKSTPMKKILIVGAGGFGRELLCWAGHHADCGRKWTIEGFINDRADALDGFNCAKKVLGGIADYQASDDCELLLAIGNPALKKPVVSALLAKGAKFMSFVHPSAIIGGNVSIGAGTVICPNCILSTDIEIGAFVMLNSGTSAGHDVCVGDYCTTSGGCDLTGGVHLEEGVFLGSRVSIIPGKRVGAWARVGAGSVVIGNVKRSTTVFGNPAKRLV